MLIFALAYWSRFFFRFFGRIEKIKKPFRNLLTFTNGLFKRSDNFVTSCHLQRNIKIKIYMRLIFYGF